MAFNLNNYSHSRNYKLLVLRMIEIDVHWNTVGITIFGVFKIIHTLMLQYNAIHNYEQVGKSQL